MMRYKLLGQTGLRVSELCLGTMTFGQEWGFGATDEVSKAMFDAFVEAGGNFIDTANTYCNGTSERLLGAFVASDRHRFVIGSKYALSTCHDDPNAGGNTRKSMVLAVEQSLRRLGTDYLDVYWMHAWDAVTPVDEVMRGLDDLVRAGKILYAGVSNTPAWVVSQANTLAQLRGWSRFVGLQVEYNLLERTAERELIPMAQAHGLSLLAWSPLAGGVLSGTYLLAGDEVHIGATLRGAQHNGERLTRESMHLVSVLVRLASELERPPSQVALNWLRQSKVQPIPIVAGRTLEQMQQNLGCLDFEIDPDRLAQLDAASGISLGFPQRFLAYEPLRHALYGAKRHLFDPPLQGHP
jgi:aryl-alcohol dehydrogenase-like predicted oxidoreductase